MGGGKAMRKIFKQFDRAKTRNSVFIFLVFMLLGLFQNCSKGFAVKNDATSSLTSSQASSSGAAPSAVSAPSPGDCTFDGKPILNGTAVNAYVTSTVPFGQSCESQIEVRKCQTGVLSGSASYSSCGVGVPAACVFNDTVNGTINPMTVVSSKSITAWQTSSVKYGQSCVSETRACTNGTLSGSFTNSSCHEPVLKKIETSNFGARCAQIDDKLACWGYLGKTQITSSPSGFGLDVAYVPESSPRVIYSSGVTDFSVRSERWECHIVNGAADCTGYGVYNYNNNNNSVELAASGATRVWVGNYQACAMVNSVFNCWTLPDTIGAGTGLGKPVQPLPGQIIVDMDIVGGSSCALTAQGAVICWETRWPDLSFINIKTVIASGASKVMTDFIGTGCAIVGKDLKCWSIDISWPGILMPDGTSVKSQTPITVMTGVSDFSQAALGQTKYLCAVKLDTSLVCWGSDQGFPALPVKTILPVGVARVSTIYAGYAIVQMVDGSVLYYNGNLIDSTSIGLKVNLGF